MNYNEALSLIEKEFETIKDSSHSKVIRTGLTYDGCNGFCVCVYDYGDVVKITDMSETRYFFFEVEDEEWEKLCKKHGFELNGWRIERVFNSMNDLYEYIAFIDMISDKYCGL